MFEDHKKYMNRKQKIPTTKQDWQGVFIILIVD